MESPPQPLWGSCGFPITVGGTLRSPQPPAPTPAWPAAPLRSRWEAQDRFCEQSVTPRPKGALCTLPPSALRPPPPDLPGLPAAVAGGFPEAAGRGVWSRVLGGIPCAALGPWAPRRRSSVGSGWPSGGARRICSRRVDLRWDPGCPPGHARFSPVGPLPAPGAGFWGSPRWLPGHQPPPTRAPARA